jgi:hypothetical protein
MGSRSANSVSVADLLKSNGDPIPAGTVGVGRHERGLIGTLVQLVRVGDWHAFWCRLGDAVDEFVDVAVAVLTFMLIGVAVLTVGVVVAFAGGLVFAAAYALAFVTAGALWLRWWRQQP